MPIANGSPVNTIPVSSLNPQTAFAPAATDVWGERIVVHQPVSQPDNSIGSRSRETMAASLCCLPSGTPRERCFIQQYRFLGFQKWRVEVIVGVLPVLMHLALALFFIGLSLFLHPLQAALSWVIWMGTVLLIVAYVIMTILPMCFPAMPIPHPTL